MKQLASILFSVIALTPLYAQETYENANIAMEDLNGTARYVGMGGAMDALGTDISTISSNPAGIGLFRHSTANVSFGFVSQQGGKSFADGNKTNMSFDQAGFVYAHRTGHNSFLNFAFNYHKSRNFDYILSAADALNGASQNKLSYMKGAEGLFDIYDNNGTFTADNNTFNQVDYLYYNALLSDENGDFYFNEANGYLFNRANSGYIGEYDFNISGNINDRVYLGLTFGISDVNYKGYGEYTETLADASGAGIGNVTLADERRIDGTGFNVKAGIIFRPIEASPFRIGISVATPTWYDLTTTNYTYLQNNTNVGMYDSGEIGEIDVLHLPDVSTKSGRTVIAQPGLRYAQADALIHSLLLDETFSALSLAERTAVQQRILTEIKGRMLEDIVLLETKLANPKKQVFVLQFPVGEFDMVVFDPEAGSCRIFEIKHSEEAVPQQYRHLIDEQKCAQTEHRYGLITGKFVLYRGESQVVEGIQYQNVEEYLRSLA